MSAERLGAGPIAQAWDRGMGYAGGSFGAAPVATGEGIP